MFAPSAAKAQASYKQFNNSYGGIAIDSDGRIVVADTFNHGIQVLE
jgi:hypothetical protein